MYLRVKHGFEPQAGLNVLVCFSLSALREASPQDERLSFSGSGAPLLAARARVVRTENHPDGTVGIGLRFERYRFI